jgi:hypothetical protein
LQSGEGLPAVTVLRKAQNRGSAKLVASACGTATSLAIVPLPAMNWLARRRRNAVWWRSGVLSSSQQDHPGPCCFRALAFARVGRIPMDRRLPACHRSPGLPLQCPHRRAGAGRKRP